MGIKKRRKEYLNKMTDFDISEAKRYLSYYLGDYEQGCRGSLWCLSRSRVQSDKIKNVILKTLTYLCIDFDYKYWDSGSCWSLRVWFK